MKYIESLQNPLVNNIVRLQTKTSERKKRQLFVVEGSREIHLAIQGGYSIDQLLICEGYQEQYQEIIQSITVSLCIISKTVYQKLSYRSTTEGILALVHMQSHRLEELSIPQDRTLLLVAESPEKPGNIGAILRTADAAGVDAVIIADANTDIYNPNVVRASLGALFTVPIAITTTKHLIDYLRQKGIAIYAALIDPNSVSYYEINFTVPCAIVLGSEAHGLTQEWKKAADAAVIIPMQGKVDSINLSVSAGILIFEAKNQRR